MMIFRFVDVIGSIGPTDQRLVGAPATNQLTTTDRPTDRHDNYVSSLGVQWNTLKYLWSGVWSAFKETKQKVVTMISIGRKAK